MCVDNITSNCSLVYEAFTGEGGVEAVINL